MVPEIGLDERVPFARGVALLLCLLSVAILFSQLGSVNQDLGATEWSLAWMFTLPASTDTNAATLPRRFYRMNSSP